MGIRKRVNWPKPDVQNEKLKKERIQHETFTKCDQCQSVPLAKVQSALFYFHFLPHFCTNAVSAKTGFPCLAIAPLHISVTHCSTCNNCNISVTSQQFVSQSKCRKPAIEEYCSSVF